MTKRNKNNEALKREASMFLKSKKHPTHIIFGGIEMDFAELLVEFLETHLHKIDDNERGIVIVSMGDSDIKDAVDFIQETRTHTFSVAIVGPTDERLKIRERQFEPDPLIITNPMTYEEAFEKLPNRGKASRNKNRSPGRKSSREI